MKLVFSDTSYKTSIIFFHGFRRSYDDFNPVQKSLSNFNFIEVSLNDEDYIKPIPKLCEELMRSLPQNQKTVIIAHSQGCFYAIELAKIYPECFCKLLLIDPTSKDHEYFKLLQNSIEDPVQKQKLENWDEIPSGLDLSFKVIVYIHLNIKDTVDKIVYFDQITNKNIKSRLIVHYNVGHMIHQKLTAVIAQSILDLNRV